jgi:hypothetical protein
MRRNPGKRATLDLSRDNGCRRHDGSLSGHRCLNRDVVVLERFDCPDFGSRKARCVEPGVELTRPGLAFQEHKLTNLAASRSLAGDRRCEKPKLVAEERNGCQSRWEPVCVAADCNVPRQIAPVHWRVSRMDAGLQLESGPFEVWQARDQPVHREGCGRDDLQRGALSVVMWRCRQDRIQRRTNCSQAPG